MKQYSMGILFVIEADQYNIIFLYYCQDLNFHIQSPTCTFRSAYYLNDDLDRIQ